MHSPAPVLHYDPMEPLSRRQIQLTLLSGLVALLLTGLLYGDVLTLPLFSDDLVQIPWLESLSWQELWTSSSPYGYYRPLWYSLWRLWGKLVGGLHPWGLHLLNVIAHFAAASLTGLLAAAWMSRTTSREERACAAALATALFAIFPFSRQAVAWPGALYNPLVTAMAAAAVLAYDRGRPRHRLRWFALALLLAALAPFNYESGLLVGPLVILIEAIGWVRGRWRRRSWWPLAFLALFVVEFVTWRAMRGAGVTGFGLRPRELWRNLAYLTQGLIYPAAPLAQRLVAWLGIDPVLALCLVGLPTLALVTWSAWRWDRGALALGVAWFALFALPPLVTMEADWFALAPRFLYTTATGISLLWAATVSHWLAKPARTWGKAAIAVAMVALLTPAILFVRRGVQLYQLAGETIWDAAEAAAERHPVLLVNLPRRITPSSRTYPLGFEGITPLPTRVTAEQLAYVHTGLHDAAEAVAFGIVATEQPAGYGYQLFGETVGWEELAEAARQAHGVYLTRYGPERLHLVEAGALRQSAPDSEPLARFGDRVTLLEATAACDETGQVRIAAQWQTRANVQTDATVFAHLLGQDGTLVAQADGYPLLGMLPFWLWEPSDVVRDVRHFDAVPGGDYAARLGIWEITTGERWPAEGVPTDFVTLRIQCP